jgi:FAD/FMN-containing dehydrogenase
MRLTSPRVYGAPSDDGSPTAYHLRVDRREFVSRSARIVLAAAAAPVAAACTSSEPEPTGSPSSPSPTSTPTGSTVPVQVNWTAFGDSLDGTLIRPGESAYATAHQLYDPLFDGTHPAGIAICKTVSDVQRSIVFARTNGLPFAARCGGHSYAGYSTSTGLVIDLGGLDTVAYDASSKLATVGSGVRLIDVAAGLAPSGVVVPGGTCATVGVSGLTLGGGQGILGRKLGLTCDALRQVTIVTADGNALTCDATSNEDLFWACRGGGGGNFGIVTSFVFKPHPLTQVTLFSLHWPWAAAADVMSAWQTWGPNAPDELWSDCHLLGAASGNTASVNGAYVGNASSLTPLLNQLRSAIGTAPSASSTTTMSYLDAALLEAGCSGWTVPQCRLPSQGPSGKLGREASLAKSDYFAAPISDAALSSALSVIGQRAQDPSLGSTGGGLLFDAWGGVINRVPPASTAFVHRTSKFLCQYFVSLPSGASSQTVSKNRTWLQHLYGALHPQATGFAYQNYIDPDLRGWQQAYYGSNLSALIDVKRRYDPDDAFHFAQSIPVA